MNHLPTVLILILASTNASKYYQPNQDSPSRNGHRGSEIVVGGFPFGSDEERFLIPKFSPADEWEFPPDPRIFLQADLKSFENLLLSQNEQEDDRMKRMKTSLSIDNPLDVLRQQYYRALARRMKYKSIEKNREHLIKTGKRTAGEPDYRVNFDFLSKSSQQKNFNENAPDDIQRFSSTLDGNGQNPTTRRYGNRFDEISYQT